MAQGPLGKAGLPKEEMGILSLVNGAICIVCLISMRHRGGAEGGRSWRGAVGSSDLHRRILCAYAWPAHGPSGKPLAPSNAVQL